jgi:diguanylate cyclase (GGDEF)-like protein
MPHRATERQVLVFAPGLDNGRVLARRLEAARIGCRVCVDVDHFAAQLEEFGEASGAVVVTADGLRQGAGPALTRFRSREPAWSRLPVVLLAPAGTAGVGAWPGTDTLTQPTTARRLIAHVERAIENRSRQRRMARDNDALQQLALQDALTGLPNRLALVERIEELQADRREREASFAVAFIDLDDFKRINDELGHGVGDAFLKVVGQRLAALLREEDSVARLAGDEFTVVLTQLRHPREAAVVASKIVESLAQPFEVDDRSITSGASIGVALFPQDADTGDLLIRRADIAMYEAKKLGRSMYRFYSTDANAGPPLF